MDAELAASPKPNNYAIAFDESVSNAQILALLSAGGNVAAVQLAADGSAALSQYVDVTSAGAFNSVASVSTIDFATNTPPNMYTYVLASANVLSEIATESDFVAESAEDTTHEFVRSAAEPDGNVICDVTALTFSGSVATLQLSVAANIAIAPFTAGSVKAYTVALSVNTLDDANVAAAIQTEFKNVGFDEVQFGDGDLSGNVHTLGLGGDHANIAIDSSVVGKRYEFTIDRITLASDVYDARMFGNNLYLRHSYATYTFLNLVNFYVGTDMSSEHISITANAKTKLTYTKIADHKPLIDHIRLTVVDKNTVPLNPHTNTITTKYDTNANALKI